MPNLTPIGTAVSVPVAQALAQHAHDARGALSENTLKALRLDSALWTGWCRDQGAIAIPAAPGRLAQFVDQIGLTRKPATVRRIVASISHMHRAAGVPDTTKAEAVKLAVRRLARAKGTAQRQAAPLTAAVARQMGDVLGDSLADLRDRAMILVARDLLARCSELVALNVGDIQPSDDGTATATIRRSKTDQEGEGAIRFVGPGATSALKAWLAARGKVGVAGNISQEMAMSAYQALPLFSSLSPAGRRGARGRGGEQHHVRRLSQGDVSRVFKRVAKRANLDPAGYSGHSGRVGMAVDLVASGADLAGIMQAGRWASPQMVSRYTRREEARRGAVARLYGVR